MFYCLFLTFNMRVLKAYLLYKFTAQRVTKVSFFEVTTSRSRAVVNEFHNRELENHDEVQDDDVC